MALAPDTDESVKLVVNKEDASYPALEASYLCTQIVGTYASLMMEKTMVISK